MAHILREVVEGRRKRRTMWRRKSKSKRERMRRGRTRGKRRMKTYFHTGAHARKRGQSSRMSLLFRLPVFYLLFNFKRVPFEKMNRRQASDSSLANYQNNVIFF